MKYILPLGIFALLVAGFSYYALVSGPDLSAIQVIESESVTPSEQQVGETDPASRQSFSGAGSIQSLIARGDSLECAITYIPNPAAEALTGNLFTYEGDLRGDFVVPTPDLSGIMVTSIIIADGSIWQWTEIDGETAGSIQPAIFDQPTLERLVSPIGFVNEVQYDCLTWPQVDYTIFEAPASILFTDAGTASFEAGTIYPEGEF